MNNFEHIKVPAAQILKKYIAEPNTDLKVKLEAANQAIDELFEANAPLFVVATPEEVNSDVILNIDAYFYKSPKPNPNQEVYTVFPSELERSEVKPKFGGEGEQFNGKVQIEVLYDDLLNTNEEPIESELYDDFSINLINSIKNKQINASNKLEIADLGVETLLDSGYRPYIIAKDENEIQSLLKTGLSKNFSGHIYLGIEPPTSGTIIELNITDPENLKPVFGGSESVFAGRVNNLETISKKLMKVNEIATASSDTNSQVQESLAS